MPPRARFEIFEIEAKEIVAFDHVGIALLDNRDHLLEHRALVHLGARSTRSKPVESVSEIAITRSPSRAADGNSKPGEM